MTTEPDTTGRPRWRRPLLLAGLFLGVYLLGLLLMLPASVALEQAERRGLLPAEVAGWDHAGGTLFTGHLSGLRADDLHLGDVGWNLRPAALLRGRLEMDLQLTPLGAGEARARLAISPGGLHLQGLNGQLPATALRPFMPAAAVRIDGHMEVHEMHGRMDWQGRVEEVSGDFIWQDAAVGIPRAYALGTQRARFADDDGRIAIRVDGDPRAALEADGLLHVDLQQNPPGMDGRVRFAAREHADDNIEAFLRHAMTQGPNGEYVWEATAP